MECSDTMLLQVWVDNVKDLGLMWYHAHLDSFQVVVNPQPVRISILGRAKHTLDMMYSKETFTKYPDVYTNSFDFIREKRISEVNPQQADYNWGTVDMVEYKAGKFGKQKALLYKPEDFDPTRNIRWYSTSMKNTAISFITILDSPLPDLPSISHTLPVTDTLLWCPILSTR